MQVYMKSCINFMHPVDLQQEHLLLLLLFVLGYLDIDLNTSRIHSFFTFFIV